LGVHTLRDSYKLDEAGDAIRARAKAAMRRRQHEASDGHEEAEIGESAGRGAAGAAGAARTSADDGDSGAGDGAGADDDEFGGDVFDDFGELPPEFWDGTWDTPGAGDEPLATGVGVT
jgi:hypothetical protein